MITREGANSVVGGKIYDVAVLSVLLYGSVTRFETLVSLLIIPYIYCMVFIIVLVRGLLISAETIVKSYLQVL